MHVVAKDRDGNRVECKRAKRGEIYFCLWCDAKMYKRAPKERVQHYVCFEGENHKTKFCKNRASSNVIREIDNLKDFFNYLFADSSGRKGGHEPTEGPVPPLCPPGTEEVDIDINLIDVDEQITKPFRTLKQLWEYGLDSLDPRDPESHSEVVIFESWYKKLFHLFEGGNKVIQAEPIRVDYQKKKIIFECRWQVRRKDSEFEGQMSQRWRNLVLQFDNQTLFKDTLGKLCWEKCEQPTGALRWEFRKKKVLVAGCWIPEEDVNYQYYAKCTSKRQIYVITE